MTYPNEYLFSSATISSFLKKKPSSCASFKRGKSIIKKKSNLLYLSKILLGGSGKIQGDVDENEAKINQKVQFLGQIRVKVLRFHVTFF